MRILITGGTGFIGGHLIRRLAPEHEIYALVRRHPPEPITNVHYIHQDLGGPLNRGQLPRTVDAIIHQAALIDTDMVKDDALPFLVNVIGTWRLLNYAADASVQTFVYASTGGIYGCRNRPFDESDAPNPMDLYSLTKAQAELAVHAASNTFRKVVLRYFFPYGVGTPNPIPNYVRKAVLGEPIEQIENGGPKFNPLHISDAVEATVRSLQVKSNSTLNIAGTEITTFSEIARMAAHAVGRQPSFNTVPLNETIAYYQADLVAQTDRMQAELDFRPRTSLETGIAELASFYYNPD